MVQKYNSDPQTAAICPGTNSLIYDEQFRKPAATSPTWKKLGH